MRRLIALLAFLLLPMIAEAACPAVLTDCPNVNANNGSFGGALNGNVTVPGGVPDTIANRLGRIVWASDYGVVGDGKDVNDIITIANGSNVLLTTTALFSANDCHSGLGCTGAADKTIGVWGARATVNSNNILTTNIVGFTSPTQVTLANAATAAVSAVNKELRWGTDNQATGQALMALQASGGAPGRVCFADGLYMFNGPPGVFQPLPQHSPVVNPPNQQAYGAAIVLFPDIDLQFSPTFTIDWEGCQTQPPNNNGATLSGGAIPPVNRGTIFTTTQAKIYTGACPGSLPVNIGPQNQCYPTMFGGASASGYYPFTGTAPVMRYISFRLYDNPQISGINCYLCTQVTFERLWFDTGVPTAPTFPNNTDQGAIFLPKAFNGANSWAKDIGVSGYASGVTFAEWAYMQNIQIFWANKCFIANGGPSHKAIGLALGCQRAVYGLYVNTGGIGVPIEFVGFDVEQQGSGPYATIAFFYDPANQTIGSLEYHVGVGVWSQNGGANMIVNAMNKKLTGAVVAVKNTVGALPTCNAAATGQQYLVTDATAPSYLGTLTGGGAVFATAICNGAAWVAH